MDILKFLFNVLIFPGGIFTLIFALLIAGIDRKVVARMQLRQGPPLFQPCYDMMKLLGKDTIIPDKASKGAFLFAPVLGLVALFAIPVFIPMYNSVFLGNTSDVIVVIYLLTIPAVAMVIGGTASASPFAQIGASREVVTMLAYELPLVMAILSVCKVAGTIIGGQMSFSFESIQALQLINGPNISNIILIPAAIAFLMVIPAEVGVVPFDIAEAETEICEGPLAEYSGLYLGLFKLSQNIKMFIMAGLFVALFFGGAGLGLTENYWINIIINIVLFLVLTIMVVLVSISFTRSIVGRLKINQALKYYWTIPAVLSVISFVLVNIKL